MNKSIADQLRAALPNGLAGMVFDCDGVLIDSRESNIRFYNLARSYFGLPPMNETQEEFVHMHTSRQSIEHVLPPFFIERLDEAMRRIDYMRDIAPYIKPEEGIFELLDALRQAGIRLAVHTNRTSMVGELLADFKLKDYFDPIITAGTHQPKPDPEGALAILECWGERPDKVLFVGDSLLDEKAARCAGLAFASFKNPELDADVRISGFKQMLRGLAELGMVKLSCG